MDADVEIYVALRFEIDNWRGAGVRFHVRTGKHMSERMTEIAIRFKLAPYAALHPNWLVLSVAPEEGMSLQFEVKRQGAEIDLAALTMDFRYGDWFRKAPIGSSRDGASSNLSLTPGPRHRTGLLDIHPGGLGQTRRRELLARDGRAWRQVSPSLGEPQ